jgi:hypothetical protein
MSYTKKTFDETLRDFKNTMRLWKSIKHWSISRNSKGRNGSYRITLDEDGQDRELIQTWDYSSVAVTLVQRTSDGDKTRSLEMRKYASAADNFRALYNCLEDLRMFEQRGLSELAEQFYRPQLPPPQTTSQAAPLATTPYTILGVAPDAPMDVIEAAYKAQARRLHPDAGGATADFQRLTDAMAQIRKERSTS